LLVITTCTTAAGSGCTDGILIVGGKTATGPSKDISLLSSDWRWCSSSGFPELPYPLVSPAAYLHDGSLLVCGFPGKRSCKYTQQGWAGWEDLSGLENETDFKMDFSSSVGSVMMMSKDTDYKTKFGANYHKYNLRHNPAYPNPRGITSWMGPFVGSPFIVDRDLQNASFSDFRGDLYFTGGFKVFDLANGKSSLQQASSSASVAKWSFGGNARTHGFPIFEDEIIPDMTEAREGHASTVFDEKLVVSGGYLYSYAPGHHLYKRHKSAEYFDWVEWKAMASMSEERSHFGLESMCGVLVAIGGMGLEDTMISTVEVARSVESNWNKQLGMELPEGRGYFASLPVRNMQCK